MIELTNFEELPSRKREIGWGAVGVSALCHISLLLLLAFVQRPRPKPADDATQAAPEPQLTIPAYQPPSPKVAPRVPPKQQTLGPDTKRPDDPPIAAGPDRPPPDPDLIDPTRKLAEAAPPLPTPEVEKPAETKPAAEQPRVRFIQGPSSTSTGKVLATASPLGRSIPDPVETKAGSAAEASAASAVSAKSAFGRTGFDQGDGQLWQPTSKVAAGQCVKIPDLGKDAAGRPILATVEGRVFWDDHVTPLAGAQLQILNTGFSTFSDSHGEYLLKFDPNLLAKCQVQYVRVQAVGFKGAMLTLSIGAKVRSDDVLLRRN